MHMREARVAIVEDSEGFRELLRANLTLAHHLVELEADSVEEAKRAFKQRFESFGSIALDAVILDGNLRGGEDNSDGAEVATFLRELAGPDLLIISWSTTGRLVQGADVKLKKDALDVLMFLEGYEPPIIA